MGRARTAVETEITSLQNPVVRLVRSLKRCKGREETGRFFIEGARIVEEALTCGAPMETILFCPGLAEGRRAAVLADLAGRRGIRCLSISEYVFRAISDRDDPAGIGAVVPRSSPSLDEIRVGPDALVVVLYEPRDPGNLGAIIRTADGAGASGVIVVGDAADLYDPKTVRATMGSLFALPVVRLSDDEALFAWIRRYRFTAVASSPHARRRHFDLAYAGSIALLIGNEAKGLPPEVLERADAAVQIPLIGRADSLNAAAATAVLLYEVVRQRLEGQRSAEDEGR